MTIDKSSLRAGFLYIRQAIQPDVRAAASQQIIPHVLKLVPHNAVVAGYVAIRGELDVFPALAALAGRGQQLCLPVTLNNRELIFRQYKPDDVLETGAYGIAIPPSTAPITVPDVLLVPLVAFDAVGHRLGYGAGYYDRAIHKLKQKNNNLKVFGVAFFCQKADAIPAESTDEKLDAIITEMGIVLPNIN
ncbi:MAG: 5-formyltetrahydrofolate cyclo-ligase [Alphaproteobacteria bacterium]